MKPTRTLLAGPVAAVIFAATVLLLPLGIRGYNSVHQTVSEIGMVGSPMRIPFTVLVCIVALCLLVFGLALRSAAIDAGHSSFAGYLTICAAISAAGVGLFAFPAAPHNYFGLSELIGYQAPWVLALNWRRDPSAAGVVRASWLLAVLVWIVIALNLSVLDRSGALWAHERPIYGLVQRSLFAVFFLWCAVIGAMLSGDRRHKTPAGNAAAQAV
ncbi:MAG: DUF998 domain-containing protein [Steroidobacteraceae bacterium]